VELLANPEAWVALLTLTALELVLGIDNIIFISILAGRLPEEQRERARKVGLGLAMLMRIGLLFAISWVTGLTRDLFQMLGQGISGRDLILLLGGAFLVAKSTTEIHHKLEGQAEESLQLRPASFGSVLVQIMLLDVVFSLDSVITAVGMVEWIEVMVAAVILSVGLMLVFSGAVNAFVHKHPTIRMLALSFLLLIGVTLIADGLGQHISKPTIYFAMAFSLGVELLNLKLRKPPGGLSAGV
jgi:predicted tellurium resistance membrane protein TerC